MTNTLNNTQTTAVSITAETFTENISHKIHEITDITKSTVQYTVIRANTRVRAAIRVFVASMLFMVAGFTTLTGSVSAVFAKKQSKLTAKVKQIAGGQFKLLNIYNRLLQEKPEMMRQLNSRMEGLASWYGGMFHGRKTAMGTTYNMNEMTAASRTLPLGTQLKVTNQANNESCIVTVTDRGPYVAERVLDLSFAAAKALDYVKTGTAQIKMEILGGNNENIASTSSDDNLFAGVQTYSENVASTNNTATSTLADLAALLPTGMITNLYTSLAS
jgi:rare lipoprotein A (peptidoglycan hydrolase)